MSFRVIASRLLPWLFFYVTHLIFNRMFLWDVYGSFSDLKESSVLHGKVVACYGKGYCS